MTPARERRSFWIAVLALCAIAVAISIRRLVVLAGPMPLGNSDSAALDAVFAAKRTLTASHVLVGLVLALAIPIQFSARIRTRYRRVHRWLGRFLLLIGLMLVALGIAWWHIRHRDVTRHREWMLRASGIALGIATTRPIMAIFFATSPLTGLKPTEFFGVAMWIGFTSTVLAAEVYIRCTRSATPVQSSAAMTGATTGVSFG